MEPTNQIPETTTKEEDEISLIDLLAVLFRYRVMIFAVTAAAALCSVIFSIVSAKLPPERSPRPRQYTATAALFISSPAADSYLLSSIKTGETDSTFLVADKRPTTYSSLITYIAGTESFLTAVAEKTGYDSTSATGLSFKTDYSQSSGVLTLTCTDTNAERAEAAANSAAELLEDKLKQLGAIRNGRDQQVLEQRLVTVRGRLQELREQLRKSSSVTATAIASDIEAEQAAYNKLTALSEMFAVILHTEMPSVQILDKAKVPAVPVGFSRLKLCLLVTFSAFFLAVFLAFALNAIENIRNDPEMMEKFRSFRYSKKN